MLVTWRGQCLTQPQSSSGSRIQARYWRSLELSTLLWRISTPKGCKGFHESYAPAPTLHQITPSLIHRKRVSCLQVSLGDYERPSSLPASLLSERDDLSLADCQQEICLVSR